MAETPLSIYYGPGNTGLATVVDLRNPASEMNAATSKLIAIEEGKQQKKKSEYDNMLKTINPDLDKPKFDQALRQHFLPKYKEMREKVVNEYKDNYKKTGRPTLSVDTETEWKTFQQEYNSNVEASNKIYDMYVDMRKAVNTNEKLNTPENKQKLEDWLELKGVDINQYDGNKLRAWAETLPNISFKPKEYNVLKETQELFKGLKPDDTANYGEDKELNAIVVRTGSDVAEQEKEAESLAEKIWNAGDEQAIRFRQYYNNDFEEFKKTAKTFLPASEKGIVVKKNWEGGFGYSSDKDGNLIIEQQPWSVAQQDGKIREFQSETIAVDYNKPISISLGKNTYDTKTGGEITPAENVGLKITDIKIVPVYKEKGENIMVPQNIADALPGSVEYVAYVNGITTERKKVFTGSNAELDKYATAIFNEENELRGDDDKITFDDARKMAIEQYGQYEEGGADQSVSMPIENIKAAINKIPELEGLYNKTTEVLNQKNSQLKKSKTNVKKETQQMAVQDILNNMSVEQKKEIQEIAKQKKGKVTEKLIRWYYENNM